MVNVAGVLKNLLPPTVIAGNWASILSISTPHKTFLLSNEMKMNWEKDFLKKNKVKYLLLTQGRFGNELGAYLRFFKQEFKEAGIIAIFRLYNTSVYLIKLNYPQEKYLEKLEIEKCRRWIGSVLYDSMASGKLVLHLNKGDLTEGLKNTLEMSRIKLLPGRNEFKIRFKGEGVLKLRIIKDAQVVLEEVRVLSSNKFRYKSMGVIKNSTSEGKYIVGLKILRITRTLSLDEITIDHQVEGQGDF
jgi:hypothetical protein